MTPKQFARIYGSPERVAFVKALGCSICGWDCTVPRPNQGHVIENCHVSGPGTDSGTGRKSSHQWIVPFCNRHHDEYDGGKKSFRSRYSFDDLARAAEVHQAWLDWGEERDY